MLTIFRDYKKKNKKAGEKVNVSEEHEKLRSEKCKLLQVEFIKYLTAYTRFQHDKFPPPTAGSSSATGSSAAASEGKKTRHSDQFKLNYYNYY